ncbi:RHS repeat-associated core domain-containing protein [Pantoea agglomerans]
MNALFWSLAFAKQQRKTTKKNTLRIKQAAAENAEPVYQPLCYQGQYFDAETGLHYNRSRYYDPDAGRFVSQAPIGLAGGVNLYQYAPNPLSWVDPLGLSRCSSASGQLPELRGRPVNEVERVLSQHGFTQTKVSNSAARNQVWKHSDGSEVRIHPYGYQSMNMKNGALTPKSGLNGHVHKENHLGDQLDDLGNISTNPDLTHIGISNPANYPSVRNRPHGSGR